MVRVMKGGEEVKISKRAGSYVTLRDLIEWTSKDAVRFFLLSRKPDTEYTFDVDLARGAEQRQPGVLRAVRACAHLLGAGRLGRRCGHAGEADLSPLQSPQALALMLLLAKYPDMLSRCAPTSPRTTSRSTCANWRRRTTATTTPSASWWTTKRWPWRSM
jgi:arginyl-tRNA synthetase